MFHRLNHQNKAQVSLELVASIFILLLLLAGCLKLFVWLNERMVLRQEDYEGTGGSATYSRVTAGRSDQTGELPIREKIDMESNDTSRYKDLNLDLIKGEK